jgi:hypothetical protein
VKAAPLTAPIHVATRGFNIELDTVDDALVDPKKATQKFTQSGVKFDIAFYRQKNPFVDG